MEQAVISETNALRTFYQNNELLDNGFFQNLHNSIQNTNMLIDQECTRCFLEDLGHIMNTQQLRLNCTKNYINNGTGNFIFSMFKVPYAPLLGIEACFFERLHVDQFLIEKYKTNVMPVKIQVASTGFDVKLFVALFPENHIDGIQHANDSIFYFINKFVDRYFDITHKIICSIVTEESFVELKIADSSKIEKAAIHWVWLHEYHHHAGFLPLPQYLRLKSKKILAGLEELRVDLCSMILCLEDKALFGNSTNFVFQFILAERLLRYAIEGIPSTTYDAVSSYILFNFLIKNNGICIKDTKIYVNSNIADVLVSLLDQINHIESHILKESEYVVQDRLLSFANIYLRYYGDYTINYFNYIKNSLMD